MFILSGLLGASQQDALGAGGVAALFHATVDLIDDIQDDDAPQWLPDLSPALRINTACHLVAVASIAAAELAPALPVHQTFCSMLTGQARELTRRDWTMQAYVDVSNRIAGQQIALYFQIAGAAAGKDADGLLELAAPLALLMMLHHDEASGDDRLACFEPPEVESVRRGARQRLTDALTRIPVHVRPVLDALVAEL